jgi:tRNA (mo5U34)-methyltransferase
MALERISADRVPADDIERLGPWFHNLHLPDGRQTAPDHPLGDFPSVKWRQIEPFIARNLEHWRVLDVGCNAGFYSFELARRGADVTALDIDRRYLRQARWAAERYGLADRIEFRQGSVYGLARSHEQFDLVLFLGVLYHLRHPLLALDILRQITRGQLILQTLTAPGASTSDTPRDIGLMEREALIDDNWPRMAFIEHSLANDPTNWWAPDPACVEAMVRASGFRVVTRPGHEIYLCEPHNAEPALGAELRRNELRAIFPDAVTPRSQS